MRDPEDHQAFSINPLIRSLSLFSLFILSALLLSSCSREPEIKYPNSITVALGADAKRLLPMLATDSASGDISGRIFNGLTKYDKDLNITGELAESWDISKDGLTIVFHLRKGVKWHDGADFSADDVLFTYSIVTDPKTPTPYSSNYGPVKKVEKLDSHTIKVTYTEPFASALESWGMGIIPKHLLEGKDMRSADVYRSPVGTGPYMMKEWITGQKIVLEAFSSYYEGRPKIDRYIARIIPDPTTNFLELKFGGIDFMGLTPPQYKLQSDTKFFRKYFQKFRYPSFGYTYIGYNMRSPLFSDKRVRQAISHLIKKEEIIHGVLLGYGTAATGPFPPESWAYNKSVKDPGYNPEKAFTLLKEAGWNRGSDGILRRDAEKFSFTVLINQGNEARMKTAQIIKEQLLAVGIEMNIKVLEWQAMLHDFIDKKRFEAVIMGWALSRDPDLFDIWHSSKTKEGEFNFISYSNPEVDRLLIEGRQTFDKTKRRQIYNRIHEILADEQPYTFLFVPDALPVLHKRFKGVEKAPIGIWHDFIRWSVPKDRNEWYAEGP